MKQVNLICDLQFGSCGKGLFAGFLALETEPDTVVAAWGPNSGHTFMSQDHGKMVNIALPNGIISPKLRRVLIGPGSVIDPNILYAEMHEYAQYLHGVDILIHENAAVVTDEHRRLEAGIIGTIGIGSTMKGVGEAMIQKIRRNRAKMNTARALLKGTPLEAYVVSAELYDRAMDIASVLQIEGSQGFSLSINHGFYPYCTSRDCTTHQILNDCAVPLGKLARADRFHIYGVARTYPIRVANRERNGELVGWSGPCYPDQREIEWKELGIEPELTTVTKLPRRIFTFSFDQIKQAVRMNGVSGIFLNFCNYPQGPNGTDPGWLIDNIERLTNAPVLWTGWGPNVSDIKVQ